jgi:hypothetical protein
MIAQAVDRRTHFQTEGWWWQQDVVDAPTLTALRVDLDRLSGWSADGPKDVTWSGPWITAETGHGFTPTRQLAEVSETWRAFCAGPLQASASRLFGEPAVLMNAMGIVKPPQIGQTFPGTGRDLLRPLRMGVRDRECLLG